MNTEKIIQWILFLGFMFHVTSAGEERGLRHGYGNGYGYGYGGGNHHGGGGNSAAMETIQNMIAHKDDITRTIADTGDGVKTVTTSDDPEVAQWIKDHVTEMMSRIESGNRFRQRDPFFVELFDRASGSELDCDLTVTGANCIHKALSSDQCDIDLVKAHAELVSLFLENGHDELMANHDPPDSC